MKHRFYCPDLTADRVELSEEEAGHALRVLRLREGDAVVLVDGRGTVAEAVLDAVGKHAASAVVRSRVLHPAPTHGNIHLAVAPTKQMERTEWFVEKATEIGVDRITPLLTERTERSKLRLDRLQKVVLSAMKQSQRAWLPRVDEPTTLSDLLKQTLPAQRYFGWCEGAPAPLMQVYTPSSDVLVLIGPEGDFTAEEAKTMLAHGFQAIGLGEARLRTETAALAACTWMSLARQNGGAPSR
ncbi:MAG: 16S rRNA (uracil(1498)-N(3))-methyltransferase [Flavobacteriales bacterium]|nr:16S rRNA (uracil(1498)-N(3))-methyltransferase [Flavobacteriales bacterium]